MDPRIQLNEARQTWHPPEELERSRPREVRLTGAGRALVALAVFFFLGSAAAGLLLHIKASTDHEHRRQLLEQGKDLEAQVIRRGTTRRDHPRYWAEYAFSVDGRTYQGRLQAGRRSWERMDEGTSLPVRYLPSEPQIHLVQGSEGDLMPLWLPYFIACALALAGWLVTRPLVSQRRLLAEGRPAPAVVTHHEKTQHGPVMHYMFSLLSGATARGKAGPQKTPPPPGTTLCVIYEPDRARHHGIYPLSLVSIAGSPQRGPQRRSGVGPG